MNDKEPKSEELKMGEKIIANVVLALVVSVLTILSAKAFGIFSVGLKVTEAEEILKNKVFMEK